MTQAFDVDFEEDVITAVTGPRDGFYTVHMGSMGLGVAEQYDDAPPHGIVPKVGDTIRTYGHFGRPVRGIVIGGSTVFYRTPAEQEAHNQREVERMKQDRRDTFNKERESLDAQYAALPEVFRQRIGRFRENNPDFRWEYESYELFCCTEAVKLAEYLATPEEAARYRSLASQDTYAADKVRWDREWKEQQAIDKAAGMSDGHSGNTHGATVALAYWYLAQPEAVAKMHGALAPLVGSVSYGDVPRDDVEVPA
jgi:hypothetical protein